MDRCVGCESAHNILEVAGLPWCADCRAGDLADLYGVLPVFTEAVDAERRRRVPEQRNDEKQTRWGSSR